MLVVYWRITLRGLSGRSSVLQEMRPWCHLCVSPFLLLIRRPSTLPAEWSRCTRMSCLYGTNCMLT
uniref:Uncharacterized protein n=1 Tax=Sinocyclocheilus rhinocerous TaxID=307959 RepID=A0A673FI66_9TELE